MTPLTQHIHPDFSVGNRCIDRLIKKTRMYRFLWELCMRKWDQLDAALLEKEKLEQELYQTRCKLNLAEQREWNRTVKPDVYPDPASIKVSFGSETRDVLTLCASVRITREVMQGFSRKNALASAARALAENLVKAIMKEIKA